MCTSNGCSETLGARDENNGEASEELDEEFDVFGIRTLDELGNTLSKAVNDNDYGELNEVISSDRYYVLVTGLDSNNFKAFCSQYLNLNLQDRSDHKYIYDNILSKYNLDTKGGNCNFSEKELIFLAIAANDKLAEKYHDVLLNQEDLELKSLLLLVCGQKYIDILSDKLKEKDNGIKAVSHKFFSTIALRKEFNQFFTGHITEYLKTLENNNIVDTIRNILDAASSVQNKECTKTLLNAFRKTEVNDAGCLYLATCYSKETAQAFLDGGVDVNVKDDSGMTALHFIARDAHQTAQKDTNDGWGAYIWSFLNSSKDNDDMALFLEGAKFLLSKGADIDAKDNNGMTPLHFAVFNGNLEMVKFLVKEGADFNLTYKNKTVLDLAGSSGSENKKEVIKFFEEEVEIKKKRTPLHYAVLNDNNKTLNLLLKKRCYDIDAKGSDNRTPLDLAIQNGKLEAVKLLLNCDANFNIGYLHSAMPDSVQTKKIACLLISNLKERLWKTEAERGQWNGNLASQVGKLKEKLERTKVELEQELKSAKQSLSGKISEVTTLTEELRNIEDKFAKKEEKLDEQTRKVTKLSGTIKELTGTNTVLERKNSDLTNQLEKFEATNAELEENIGSLNNQLSEKKEEIVRLNDHITELKKLGQKLDEELRSAKTQFGELQKELDAKTEESENTKDRLEQEVVSVKQELDKTTEELRRKGADLENSKKEQLKSIKDQLTDKESKISSLEGQITQLAKEKDQLTEQLNGTQQGFNLGNENKKLSAVSAQSRKQITYASVSFVLSGALAVGTSFTMFHLAICISLAVAALTFLAVGCYCSYKANTALSNVEIDNCVNPAVVEV